MGEGDENDDCIVSIEVFHSVGNMACSTYKLLITKRPLLRTWGTFQWKNKPKKLFIAKPYGCMRAVSLERSKFGPQNR